LVHERVDRFLLPRIILFELTKSCIVNAHGRVSPPVAIGAKRLAIVENCRAPKAVGVSMMSVPPSGQLATAAAAFAGGGDEELAALSSREKTPRVTYLSRVHRTPASCGWKMNCGMPKWRHEMIIR
jgi:hypothetical protein